MKRLNIKEEYVKVTKDLTRGIILQYIVKKYVSMNKGNFKEEYIELDFDKINKENLLGIALISVRRNIQKLVKLGYIEENKSSYKHTYKVNIEKINGAFKNINAPLICIEKENILDKKTIKKEDILESSYPLKDEELTIEYLKDRLEHSTLVNKSQGNSAKIFKQIFENIFEVIINKTKYVRINKQGKDYNAVKSVFMKLTSSHIVEVFNKIIRLKTRVVNFRNYVLTVIYNTYFENELSIMNFITMDFGESIYLRGNL